MPASIYRLVGRPHPTAAPVEQNQEVVPDEVPALSVDEPKVSTAEVIAAPVAAPAVEMAPVIEPKKAVETKTVDVPQVQAESVSSVAETTTKSVYPNWDPTWSKTQLLDVALQLKLNVSSVNTKSEIIAALTKAKPA